MATLKEMLASGDAVAETQAPQRRSMREMVASGEASAEEAPRDKTGFWSALGKGGGQGITLGFGDEINGAIQAGMAKLQGEDKSLAELYHLNRDTFRQEDANAEEDQGAAFNVGNIAGGLALAPLGGSTAAAKLATYAPRLGRAASLLRPGGSALSQLVKAGAGLGAATGLGTSEADSLGEMALDTAVGGTVGAGAGLGGHLLQKALGGAGKWASGKGARLLGKADDKIIGLADDAEGAVERTLRSESGTSATAGYKQARNTLDGGIDPSKLSPAKKAAFDELMGDLGESGSEGLIPGLAKKKATAAAYSEAMETAAERRALKAAELGKSSVKEDAVSLFKSHGQPFAGMAVGGLIGEQFDNSAAGAAVGGVLAGRTRGVQKLLRLVNKPGNQKALASALRGIGSGLGRMAPSAATIESAMGRSAGAVGGIQSGLMEIPAIAELFQDEDDAGRRAIVQALLDREK